MEKFTLLFDVALLVAVLATFALVVVLILRPASADVRRFEDGLRRIESLALDSETGQLRPFDLDAAASGECDGADPDSGELTLRDLTKTRGGLDRLAAIVDAQVDRDVPHSGLRIPMPKVAPPKPTPPPNVSTHDGSGVARPVPSATSHRQLGGIPSVAEMRMRAIELEAAKQTHAQQWARAEAANIYRSRDHDFTDRQMVILDAIRQAECGGRLECEDGDGGNAIGPYQIHRAYHEDSESILIDYEECRGIEEAESVVSLYFERWAPRTWMGTSNLEEAAEYLGRIHNGGPQGATRSSTEIYGRRVRALASTLAAERGL